MKRWVFVCGVVLWGLCGGSVAMDSLDANTDIGYLKDLLVKGQGNALIPELTGMTADVLLKRPQAQELLEWGREAAEEASIPETPYTLYREYQRNGQRSGYERPYFDKRRLLAREMAVLLLDPENARMERIADLVWSICEETWWVLPAHERDPWTVDLFAAETGAELAHVVHVAGDRLPEEVVARAREEVERRIFVNYLAHGREFWWDSGRNNWTGVCAGAVGEAFLLLEEDPERVAQAVSVVIEQMDRFITHGFENDGGCLEGIGYWNYGLSHFICFSEMLRARTGGAVDLLVAEKVKAIAGYPLAVVIGKDTFASFADAKEHSSVMPYIGARLAERADADGLRALAGGVTDWRFVTVLRNLVWWDGERAALPALGNAYLAESGIGRLTGMLGGKPLVLVAKAGSNGEPHNNNDVGSFVLRVGETTYLCDPGPGLYSREYFGRERYENVFANSYGHSVPRIGGKLQPTGGDRRGTLTLSAGGVMEIVFNEAYDCPELKAAERRIEVADEGLVLSDRFVFEGDGVEVEEALVTWRDVEVDGGVARIKGQDGVLEVVANEGVWEAERLEKECKANRRGGVLTRLALKRPAGPEVAVRVVIRMGI